MFAQLLTPVGGQPRRCRSSWRRCRSSRAGRPRRAAPAGLAGSLAGLVVAFIIAVAVWACRLISRSNAVATGAVFALWPVMWIVVNALLLYNIAVKSGRFDAFRAGSIEHCRTTGASCWSSSASASARCSRAWRASARRSRSPRSLLILVGFPPLEALVFVLIFNTAPVAFGALGVPVTVLGAVTGLPAPRSAR